MKSKSQTICRLLLSAVALMVFTVLGCKRTDAPPEIPPGPRIHVNFKHKGGSNMTGKSAVSAISIKSSAFGQNQSIPKKYTGEGEDLSPPLTWSSLPQDTKELALIVDDPDAPTPEPWVHWVIYKIPPQTIGLPEGVKHTEKLNDPPGALQGNNTWPAIGYRGPMPPKGHGVHHYHFKLYALDAPLDVKPGLDKKAILKAMSGHILAEGEMIGTYERK